MIVAIVLALLALAFRVAVAAPAREIPALDREDLADADVGDDREHVDDGNHLGGVDLDEDDLADVDLDEDDLAGVEDLHEDDFDDVDGLDEILAKLDEPADRASIDDRNELDLGRDDRNELDLGRDDVFELGLGRDDVLEPGLGRDELLELGLGRDELLELDMGPDDVLELDEGDPAHEHAGLLAAALRADEPLRDEPERARSPIGRIDVSLIYRRSDPITSERRDELWLVGTWRR